MTTAPLRVLRTGPIRTSRPVTEAAAKTADAPGGPGDSGPDPAHLCSIWWLGWEGLNSFPLAHPLKTGAGRASRVTARTAVDQFPSARRRDEARYLLGDRVVGAQVPVGAGEHHGALHRRDRRGCQ